MIFKKNNKKSEKIKNKKNSLVKIKLLKLNLSTKIKKNIIIYLCAGIGCYFAINQYESYLQNKTIAEYQQAIKYIENKNSSKYKEAFNSLKNMEETDNSAMSNYYLGYMYENGIGTNIDYIKAYRYYKKASDSGNSKALYELGEMFLKAEGVNRSLRDAEKYFLESYEKGNSIAIVSLAKLYHLSIKLIKDEKPAEIYVIANIYNNGIKVKQDKKFAIQLYTLASKSGYDLASIELAKEYFNMGNYQKSKEIWQKLTKSKNKNTVNEAFKNLSFINKYLNKKNNINSNIINSSIINDNIKIKNITNLKKTKTKTKTEEKTDIKVSLNLTKYYKKQIKKTNEIIVYLINLASQEFFKSVNDDVVEYNNEPITNLINKSKKGDAESQFILGNYYSYIKNNKEALNLYKLSAIQGYEPALLKLKLIANPLKFKKITNSKISTKLDNLNYFNYENILNIEDKVPTKKDFKKAGNNNPTANYNIGLFFFINGYYELAFNYLQKAALYNYPKAIFLISYYYYTNNKVIKNSNNEENIKQTINLLKNASDNGIQNASLNLGNIYYHQGLYNRAIKALEKCSDNKNHLCASAIVNVKLKKFKDRNPNYLAPESKILKDQNYIKSIKMFEQSNNYPSIPLKNIEIQALKNNIDVLDILKQQAEINKKEGSYYLADYYFNKENYQEALKYFEISAKHGYPMAYYRIANLYYNTTYDGFKTNMKLAVENYKKASELGVKNAEFILYFMNN